MTTPEILQQDDPNRVPDQPTETPVTPDRPSDEIMQLIRDANLRASRAEELAQQRADELIRAQRVPQAMPASVTPEDFISNPQKTIRDEIAAANAPLIEYINQTRRAQNLHTLKLQAINEKPMLAAHRDALYNALDSYIDPNQEPSLTSIRRSLESIVGSLLMNQPQLLTQFVTPQQQTNVPGNPPPTVRNSPPAPTPEVKPQRSLSENELFLAKKWGMTEAEYLKELDGQDTITFSRKP